MDVIRLRPVIAIVAAALAVLARPCAGAGKRRRLGKVAVLRLLRVARHDIVICFLQLTTVQALRAIGLLVAAPAPG